MQVARRGGFRILEFRSRHARCENGKHLTGNLLGVYAEVAVHAIMNTRDECVPALGARMTACSIMAGDAVRTEITTIEAVSGKVAEAVKSAWERLDVSQCGYCQPGQIMSAITLLTVDKKPTDADIDAAMEGNVCRCGTYVRIRQAIHTAAKALA